MNSIAYHKKLLVAIAALSLILIGSAIKVPLAEADSFFEAMKREDIVAMSRYVDQLQDPNIRLNDGRTALMLAAKLSSREVVKKLLSAGAEINDRNLNGGTALMYSAIPGDSETLMLLLNHGAEVNVAAKFGWTALMVAAAKGHAEFTSILLDHGAEVNTRDVYRWTPLMRASYSGHEQAVAALLSDEKIDVNAQDDNGATAMHHAATNGHVGIVELLLEHNASSSIRDRFELDPRGRAIVNNHASIVSLLDSRS